MKAKVLTYLIVGVLICAFSQIVYAIPIIQVTDDGWDDYHPRISGNNIVWYKWPGTCRVHLYDGSAITDLGAGVSPDISGTNIVYYAYVPPSRPVLKDTEIFLYDGVSTTQITNNDLEDVSPAISGNYIVWNTGPVTGPYETPDKGTYLYDGTTIEKISDIPTGAGYGISGNKIAWVGYGSRNLYFYDGNTVSQIAGNADFRPSISGDKIAFTRFDGNDYEIFLYDIPTGITTQITDNNVDDGSPSIFGDYIVWNGFDGHDWEIFSYDGSNITQKTNNNVFDGGPVISGLNVAWQRYSSHEDGQDSEIFFASNVLEQWEDTSSPPGPEPIPEPTTIVLIGFGVLGLLGIVIRPRRKEK